jgi:hypothetical protein
MPVDAPVMTTDCMVQLLPFPRMAFYVTGKARSAIGEAIT